MVTIVYCGSRNVFEGLFLSATSVARRTHEALEIIVLTMDASYVREMYLPINDGQIELLDKAVKSFNPESSVKKYDFGKRFLLTLANGKNAENKRFSPYTLLRLLLDDKIFENRNKAIYLDIDTMACSDIRRLWDIDLDSNGYEFAAALDSMGKFWINRRYCNAGVILFNLKKCRETGLFKASREWVNKHKSFMPDQTALDRTVKQKLIISNLFNEQRDIKLFTVIKHFNAGIKWVPVPHFYNIKQWDRESVHKKLKITAFDEDYKFYDEFTAKEQSTVNQAEISRLVALARNDGEECALIRQNDGEECA